MHGKLYCPHFVTEQGYRQWLFRQLEVGEITLTNLKSIKDTIAYVGGHQYKRVLLSARRWALSQQ